MLKPAWRLLKLLLVSSLALLFCGCSEIEEAQKQNRVAAYVLNADQQLNLGHPAQARIWYDRAVAMSPDALETYLGIDENGSGGLAVSLARHNDWPDMVNYLSKAVTRPTFIPNWQLWMNLAQAQERIGQSAAARVSYQHALDNMTAVKKGAKMFAVEPGAYLLNKAYAEWGAGQRAQAVEDFNRIITRYPDGAAEAQNSLAYSYAVADINLPEAYSLAQKAVTSTRQDGSDDNALGAHLDTLGWVEYRMGKYDDAERDLEEALDYTPREPVLHYHLAEIYHALGEKQFAQIEIERAAAICPSDIDTQEAMRQIEPAASQPAKA